MVCDFAFLSEDRIHCLKNFNLTINSFVKKKPLYLKAALIDICTLTGRHNKNSGKHRLKKKEAMLKTFFSSVFWVVTIKYGYQLRSHFTSQTQTVWQDAIWRFSERNLSVVVFVWYKYYKVKFIFFQWDKMLTLYLDSKLTHDITFGMNISFHWKVWPNLHISSMYLIS